MVRVEYVDQHLDHLGSRYWGIAGGHVCHVMDPNLINWAFAYFACLVTQPRSRQENRKIWKARRQIPARPARPGWVENLRVQGFRGSYVSAVWSEWHIAKTRIEHIACHGSEFNMFIMLKSKAQGSQGFARIAVCCLNHVLMSREWLPPRFWQMCSKSSRLSSNFVWNGTIH